MEVQLPHLYIALTVSPKTNPEEYLQEVKRYSTERLTAIYPKLINDLPIWSKQHTLATLNAYDVALEKHNV